MHSIHNTLTLVQIPKFNWMRAHDAVLSQKRADKLLKKKFGFNTRENGKQIETDEMVFQSPPQVRVF